MIRMMVAPIVNIQSCLGRSRTDTGYTVIDEVSAINGYDQ